jgi:acylphosphatase
MIAFCQRGPPGAIVKKIEVKWENPTGEFKDFRIRY